MANEDELKESLACLQTELKTVDKVDDASRQALQDLDGNIRRVLENSGAEPGAHHLSLLANLEDSVEYFEASHPQLTILMNRVIKALSDMGI